MNLCARNVATGIHRDGGFAEYAAFPAHKAVVLPPGLDPRHGAFCEPLACTLHGVDIGAPRSGERVLVIGGGVIGLLALQLAAPRRGRGDAPHPQPRQARARHAHRRRGHRRRRRRACAPSGRRAPTSPSNAPGSPRRWPRRGALTRAGGRVVVLGVLPQGERVPIEPFDLLVREIQLHFSYINPFTQTRAAELIASGRIAVEPLISRQIPLGEAVAAISAPARPGEVKVMLVPGA